MTWLNTKNCYGNLSILMHWLMVLLFIAAYSTIELRGVFEKGTPDYDLIKYAHFVIGLSILSLAIARLSMRNLQTAPESIGDANSLQNKLAKNMHYLLYGFMIVMPILGWLTISAEGKALQILGFSVPMLVSPDHDLAEVFEEVHEIIGTLGYFLIGGHAAAALFHHYLLKDSTLKRMLGMN